MKKEKKKISTVRVLIRVLECVRACVGVSDREKVRDRNRTEFIVKNK